MKTIHIQHLYNRIGFGIIPKDIAELKRKSRLEILDSIFKSSYKNTPLTIDFPHILIDKSKESRKDFLKKNTSTIRDYNNLWIKRLGNTNELLREKMTLFWANHFVCSNKSNFLFVQQFNNTLREHSLGNFKPFIKAISKEPAMMKYLSTKQNIKKNPNENFARELLELFSLGEGNYSEKDIKECARAFTGYKYDKNGVFFLEEKHHDFGQKTFFNKKGNYFGDDIIDLILEQKQCAKFISEKLYKYFVNDKIDQSHINEMVKVFYPKYNIAELMYFILSSDWFYEKKNIGVKIKSPIELIVGINTIIPFEIKNRRHYFLIQRLMNQTLLHPPNVAGWKGGKNWINSNTIVTRLRLPSILLNNSEISYSDEKKFETVILNLEKEKPLKKTLIETSVNWPLFNQNYGQLSKSELIESIIYLQPASTLNTVINNSNKSAKENCLKLLSLPEYQLC